MTVTTTSNKISYAGNGSTTTFAYNFPAGGQASNLKVYLNDVLQASGYTVTGATSPSGGSVVFGAAPASGVTVLIKRVLPLTQLVDTVNNSTILAEVFDNALDRGILVDQQLQEQIDELGAVDLADLLEQISEKAQGPATTVDNELVRFDGTSGTALQGSPLTLGDAGPLAPKTNDGVALGTSSLGFSDAFFASGAVLNFNAGDITITHGSNSLTFAGGDSGYVFNSGDDTIGLCYSSTILLRAAQIVTGADTVATRAGYAQAQMTAGSGGFAIGMQGYASTGGSWSPTGNHGAQGVVGEGLGTRAGSRVWGGNFFAAGTTAQMDDVSGVEIDVGVQDVAPLRRYGLIIASTTGNQSGSELDIMLRLTNKASGASWTDGIRFDSDGGQQPIKTGGYLFRAVGGWTCAYGVDLTGVDIANNAFASDGFSVTGAGVVTSKGITDASSAAAGNVAEELTASISSGSAVSLSNGNVVNVVSLNLTAGEWDVRGGIVARVSGGTMTFVSAAPSTTSATSPTLPNNGAYADNGASTTLGHSLSFAPRRYRVSSPTTVYLVSFANFSGTATAYGALTATRVR